MGIHVPMIVRSHQHASMRVLVAEDNAVNQRLIGAILQSLGIHALFVGDGVAALTEVRRCAFDLILTDLAMPIMDGLTCIKLIRELERFEGRHGALIYVVSSQHSRRDLAASQAAGANGHLAKPVVVSHLLDAVDKGAHSMRARQQRPEAPLSSRAPRFRQVSKGAGR